MPTMPNPLRSTLIALVALLGGMISIQSGAALAKHLFAQVGPQGVSAMRLTVGACLLLIFWRPWRHLPQRRYWRAIALYGAALGCMNLVFYMALARIPLGIAVALEFSGPLTIALLSIRRWQDGIWIACAVGGVFLLMPFSRFATPLDPLGIALALLAGICWALYILFGKQASDGVHGGTAATLGMCIACLIAVPVGISCAGSKLLSPALLPYALLVGIFASALPYSLEMYAMRHVSTRFFSIVMSIEPGVATLSGLLFLGESLSWLQLFAITLLIIASAGCTWSESAVETAGEVAA